jgi:hypothetical protein
MNIRPFTTFLAVPLFFILLLKGCTCAPPSPSDTPTHPQKEPQKIGITRNDPITGGHWWAQMEQDPQSPSQWIITSASSAHPLQDRFVKPSFISRLTDTLKNLDKNLEEGGDAPPGTLRSYGLERPLFTIQWQIDQTKFEFQLGANAANHQGRYATFSIHPGQTFIISNPRLGFLDHIGSLEDIRHNQLSLLSRNDVRDGKVFHKEKEIFSFVRVSGDWRTPDHETIISNTVHPWLNQLLHLRIENFIETTETSSSLMAALTHHPEAEVLLRDRFEAETRLKFIQKEGFIYASSSDRQEGVFQLLEKDLNIILPML